MADNDDLTPGSSGICSIGDDSMTDGIDGISQVTVPFTYSVPIFSEWKRAASALDTKRSPRER